MCAATFHARLSAIRIDLPALRTRVAEIPAFAIALVEQLCRTRHVPLKQLAPPALVLLGALPWRRNVAELHDLLDVLVRTARDAVIELEDVLRHVRLDRVRAALVAVGTLREARTRFERDYISTVLARHKGRMVDVAAELGLERANLYRKMRQLGIRRQTA